MRLLEVIRGDQDALNTWYITPGVGLKLGVNTRPPTRVPTMLGEDYKYLALFLKRFEMEEYVSRENKCMYVNIML